MTCLYLDNRPLKRYVIVWHLRHFTALHKSSPVAWWDSKLIEKYKIEKRCSLENLWLNGSLWNQNWFFYSIAEKNLLSTFIFKSITLLIYNYY